ncbi:MAG: DEAD/DEAH box helicase [Alphaproteobacteria bacterium]
MKYFNELPISPALMKNIDSINYKEMTPIQANAIPIALKGQDIIGTAQTGTGKTAAFVIPIIEKLLHSNNSIALILTPTRELATQVNDFIKTLTVNEIKLKSVLLIGGDSIQNQIQELNGEKPTRRSKGRNFMPRGAKRFRRDENIEENSSNSQNTEPKIKPRIIVATPGRVIDHLERESLKLSNCKFLVLDETDRMLDMGFGIQIDEILKYVSKDRHTLMFTATLPKPIEKLAEKYLIKPERITMGSVVAPAAKIKQEFVHVKEAEKYPKLVEELKTREGSIIVFVKTRDSAERLTDKLNKDEELSLKFVKDDQASDNIQEERRSSREDRGFNKFGKRRRDDRFTNEQPPKNIRFINGDLPQNKRTRLIEDFRKGRYTILIATEVVARGLDISHLQHVINYDLPECADDYIHRIGRTARAGAEGNALSIISPIDQKKWINIDRLMNPDKYANSKGRDFESGRNSGSNFKRDRSANNNYRSNGNNGDNSKGKKTGFFSNSKPNKPTRFARAKAV